MQSDSPWYQISVVTEDVGGAIERARVAWEIDFVKKEEGEDGGGGGGGTSNADPSMSTALPTLEPIHCSMDEPPIADGMKPTGL